MPATATVSLEATVKCQNINEIVITDPAGLSKYSSISRIKCSFRIRCENTLVCNIESLSSLKLLQVTITFLEETFIVIHDLFIYRQSKENWKFQIHA